MSLKSILVPCKQCIDYNVAIQIKPDGSGVNTNQVKMSMNPFDAIAVEAAIQMHESGQANEVCLIHIGPKHHEPMLRYGLALGAHRAIHVITDTMPEPFNTADILAHFAKSFDLVLMGKLAIDGDHSQVGGLLAGMLDWPQATCASKITLKEQEAIVSCEVEYGLQEVKLTLPAVITTDLRLNEPRYASLPNIMRAKQKLIDEISLTDIPLNLNIQTTILKTEAPKKRQAGTITTDVARFFDLLKEQGL